MKVNYVIDTNFLSLFPFSFLNFLVVALIKVAVFLFFASASAFLLVLKNFILANLSSINSPHIKQFIKN